MNFHRIEKLLEQYFDGSTSLEDEKVLKDFFEGDNIPPHLISLKDSFNYFSGKSSEEFLTESFDKKILAEIDSFEIDNKRQFRRRSIYFISGIAASILIIISIFINFNPFASKLTETFDNPEMAYEETKKALLLVSGAFNRGIKPIDNVSKFDDGMKELAKVESLGTGMKEVGRVSEFYNTQQKIINN